MRARRSLPSALALLFLAACAGPQPTPPPAISQGLPVGAPVEAVLTVSFEPGAPALNGSQAQLLAAFLDVQRLRQGDRVQIVAPASEDSALLERRVHLLAETMKNRGLLVDRRTAPDASRPDRLVVSTRAYIAGAPGCPAWNGNPWAEWRNEPSPQQGCATAANLAAMLYRPAEIERGTPAGPKLAPATPAEAKAKAAAAAAPLAAAPSTAAPGK
ncbi:MAG TPA: CpaD family pilus assembly lipoprotein [Azospirillaceae bacterium]|nr:CpaD family pilus assembly lipoprotein [Azospirillaceae bacterium]